jgi:hypothetical protein
MQSEDLHSEINKMIDTIQNQTRKIVFLDYDNPINKPIIDESLEIFTQCEKRLIELCITNVRNNELNTFVKCGFIKEADAEKTKAYIKKYEDFSLCSRDTEPQEISTSEDGNDILEQLQKKEEIKCE